MILRIAAMLLLALSCGAAEMDDAEILRRLGPPPPRDAAIDKGLLWLRGQTRADGLVSDRHGIALSSLAAMAHLAAGRTCTDPQAGPWLRGVLEAVLRAQDQNGYLGKSDNSRMYGHGIATLLLAEMVGETGDEGLDRRVRRALERAVAVTVNAAQVKKDQQHAGGWRYQPHEDRSDLSLSGWQLLSLHAATQVGIAVPETVVRQACAYARRLIDNRGQVGYERAGEDRPALRGLALILLDIDARDAGEGDAPRAADRSTAISLVSARMRADPLSWQGPWFFYRAYYDAVGLSRTQPELWASSGPALIQLLVDHQQADGAWPTPPGDNEGEHGPAYRTAMAILALAVDRQLLPVYQR